MIQSTSTSSPKTLTQRIGRLLRFIAFVGTAGWLFPHVCTESMDLTKLQDDQSRGVH